ncbi:MAG: hypothetical protein JO121_31740 [Deltaproteobacteria bacterium]|nr:hypothetical protein [Deltaproteobacteria bacterium]
MTIVTNMGSTRKWTRKGFVVPPGGGSILSMALGRSAALKPLGGDTGVNIMLFEETAPAGTRRISSLPRQRRGGLRTERRKTFKIGDEVTVGGRKFASG